MATLFLKYRPQIFSDLIGQSSIVKTLQNAIKAKKPAHAYLFSGSRGTGKTSTARIFAKALNCEGIKDGDPCGTCKICTDTAEGNLIDVMEIDAASHTGVDNIRDLIEKIEFTPTYAQRKVYIIDEVHMLSKGAFNALLKTLEEPPDHAFFLLATTEMHKIPETIVSRCQTFVFHRFSLEQLVDRLEDICKIEGFTAERSALECIARKAEGGLRDAISLLEQIAAETDNQVTEAAVRESLGISPAETLENFWQAILEKDTEKGFKILREINEKGGDFRTFGHDFLGFLRGRLHQNLSDSSELALILPAIEETEKALMRLKTSPIVELPLEIAVVNLCSSFVETSVEKTEVSRKSKVESRKEEEKVEVESQKLEVRSESSFAKASTSAKATVDKSEDREPEPEITVEAKSSKQTPSAIKPSESVSDGGEVTEIQIKEKLSEIAQKAGLPSFVKRSFTTTEPKIVGDKVTFQTDSNFHQEKLTPASVRIPIQNAMGEVFGKKFEVDFVVHATKKVKTDEVATAEDFLEF